MSHTKGPWRKDRTAVGNLMIRGEGVNCYLALVYSLDHLGVGDMEANADLMAAAPDLLEACEAMMKDLDATGNQPLSSQGRAHNAIARARGTQEGSDG